MIDTGKVLAYPDRLVGPRRPITADVFLTRRCNNACPYCTYARHERHGGADMEPELFDLVLARLVELGVRGVILTGGGEPTCSRSFEHACARMDETGMAYGVNTNFNIYRECRPRYLKVSLDGWDDESYRAKRGVDSYERVCENIRRYCAWRDANSPTTRVGIQMVATDPQEVRLFHEANAGLPVDYIAFRPVESRLGEYYRDEAERDRAAEIAAVAWGLGDPRVVVNPKFAQVGLEVHGCPGNRFQIAVDETAHVVYCCHKPYEVVGSVFAADILERLDEWTTDLSLCDVPCRLTSSNEVMERISTLAAQADAAFI